MHAEIRELAEMIQDEGLRGKVIGLIEDPSIEIDAERLSLEECPAGAYQHHSYEGGLLQHTISVTRIALTLSDMVEEQYGGEVDRDVVLAGSLIHDVMKRYSYTHRRDGGFMTSPLGERLDHITLLVAELYRRGFPLEVIHVAASHHGDVSPVKPKTVEALIVHIADLADSELSSKVLRAAEYLLKQVRGGRPRVSSSRKALEVVRAKTLEGWDGVRRLVEEWERSTRT